MDIHIAIIGPPAIGLFEYVDKTKDQIVVVEPDPKFKPSSLQEAVGNLGKALDMFKKAVYDAHIADRSKHWKARQERFLNKQRKK